MRVFASDGHRGQLSRRFAQPAAQLFVGGSQRGDPAGPGVELFGEQLDRREDRVDGVIERVHALRQLCRAGRQLTVGARQAFGAGGGFVDPVRELSRSSRRLGEARLQLLRAIAGLARFARESLRARMRAARFACQPLRTRVGAARFARQPLGARVRTARFARQPLRAALGAPGAAAERLCAACGRGEAAAQFRDAVARAAQPRAQARDPALGAFQVLGRGDERGVGLQRA